MEFGDENGDGLGRFSGVFDAIVNGKRQKKQQGSFVLCSAAVGLVEVEEQQRVMGSVEEDDDKRGMGVFFGVIRR